MKRRPLLIALGLGAAAALCGGALLAWRRTARSTQSDEAVDYLFSLTFEDADDARRPISAWRGKKLVVNFWATWCVPCVEEMPRLQELADELKASNVAVIGIGVDDADNIRKFRQQHAIRFDLLVAGFDGMDLARRLGNPQPVLPYTVLVSPDGRIEEQYSGPISLSELRRRLS